MSTDKKALLGAITNFANQAINDMGDILYDHSEAADESNPTEVAQESIETAMKDLLQATGGTPDLQRAEKLDEVLAGMADATDDFEWETAFWHDMLFLALKRVPASQFNSLIDEALEQAPVRLERSEKHEQHYQSLESLKQEC